MIEIRRILPAEVDAAMAILDGWNMAPRAPDAGTPEVERSGLDLARTFVALHEGRVVGVASYIVHDAELAETASLAVDPSVRGEGVGARLQEARLEEMRAQGIRRVRTETDRPATIDWYIRKFGYRKVGVNPKKHAFSLDDVDHWTVLELDL
ncbi:MAG: GNAT family N-acetyltransferase [Planctomycetota bacterium]